jgi:hypothetical protein
MGVMQSYTQPYPRQLGAQEALRQQRVAELDPHGGGDALRVGLHSLPGDVRLVTCTHTGWHQ